MNKMNKKTIIVVIVVLITIVIVFLISNTGKKEGENKKETPIPTPTEAPYFSNTGAKYISPTEDEEKEINAIAKLRSECPVKTERFTVDFSYKLSKFTVKFVEKNKKKDGELFDIWLKENGYQKISEKYFVFEK